ncbi:MAG: SEC-C metal-binding domain-containing protein [Nitrospirota bacterium]
MEQRELDRLFAEITVKAQQVEQAAIAELQSLALEVGPERLFTTVMVMLTLVPPGSASDATHGTVSVKTELLAYHLLPLFGNPPKGPLTPQGVERTLELVEILLGSYIQGNSFREEQTEGSNLPLDLKALIRHVVIDTRVVRGSAYPEQTMQEISEVQGHFEEWFSSRAGIGPRRAIDLLLAILRAEEDLGNEWRFKLVDGRLSAEKAWKEARRTKKSQLKVEQQTLLSTAHSAQQAGFLGYAQTLANVPPDAVSVPRELTKLSPEPTLKEWEGLIALIGCTPQARKVMHDPVEVRHRPLFVLPGNRVLLGDISNAVDQLWRAFEDIARQDQAFYSGAYQQHRGRWLEDRLAVLVQRVFPAETIYRKLTYPDPDRGQGATAELDAAIHWLPFLVVIETKAAQFRFASQLGDLVRLRSDVKANVTDAFEQARRAARYIQSVPEAVFLENGTGRTLVVRRDEIQRTYLITVSLHHLARIATRLASIQGLGLFRDGQYPWAISVADLDLVTQFCPGPDAFLHYAERRLAIQREVVNIQADEIDLFGAYLKTRLQANRIWEREGMKKPDWVSLSGFQEPFDEVMAHRRGDRKDAPQLRLEIPQEVEDILQELRRHESDKDARWIAFSLLSLSDRALEIVARMFRDLRSQSLNADSFRRLTHTERDLAISIVATKGQAADALLRNTQSRTLLEKYRRKCTTSIGFGVVVSDPSKPFHCAAWAEWPWAYDPEMEKLIETEPAPTPAPGSKIPGRNDPCLCGSTKKFKKCCLPKMEASRRR